MMLTRTLTAIMLLATPALGQTADPERGRAIFLRDNCYTCHGTTGAGGGALGGPRLVHAGLTANAILNELRHPRALMPTYSEKVLSDAEAADIAAYIQSRSREPQPDAKAIPLLNQ
jgi:ubiquinol-cytochrome c reductase cytochrome c subunit